MVSSDMVRVLATVLACSLVSIALGQIIHNHDIFVPSENLGDLKPLPKFEHQWKEDTSQMAKILKLLLSQSHKDQLLFATLEKLIAELQKQQQVDQQQIAELQKQQQVDQQQIAELKKQQLVALHQIAELQKQQQANQEEITELQKQQDVDQQHIVEYSKQQQANQNQFSVHEKQQHIDLNQIAYLKNQHQADKHQVADSHEEKTYKRVLPAVSESIAFHAILSHDYVNLGNLAELHFDKVITNIGGSYSANTGTFTCHQDGLYVFSWSVLVYSKYLYSEIVRNGTAIGSLLAGNNSVYSGAGRGLVVVYLNTGDEVWIRIKDTASEVTIRSVYGVTEFSGFRLK